MILFFFPQNGIEITVKQFTFAIMGSKYVPDPRCTHENLKFGAAFLSIVRPFFYQGILSYLVKFSTFWKPR